MIWQKCFSMLEGSLFLTLPVTRQTVFTLPDASARLTVLRGPPCRRQPTSLRYRLSTAPGRAYHRRQSRRRERHRAVAQPAKVIDQQAHRQLAKDHRHGGRRGAYPLHRQHHNDDVGHTAKAPSSCHLGTCSSVTDVAGAKTGSVIRSPARRWQRLKGAAQHPTAAKTAVYRRLNAKQCAAAQRQNNYQRTHFYSLTRGHQQ